MKSKKSVPLLPAFASLVLGLLVTPMGALAATIDTSDLANMGNLLALGSDPWSSTNTRSFGQSFTTPAVDTQLDSFAFYLMPDQSATITLQASIYQWDGSGTQGAALFSSASTTIDWSGLNAYGFQQVQFSTGGLNLATGSQYVAILAAAPGADNAGWGMAWDSNGNGGAGAFADPYAGGQMVVQVDAFSPWIGYQAFTGFTDAPDSIDTSFQASFSAPPVVVPEPGSLGLLALAGAGLLARRRTVWRS